MSTQVLLEWQVHPTEDEEAIFNAVNTIFPGCSLEKDGIERTARTEDLQPFLDNLERYLIRDTAREVLLSVEEELEKDEHHYRFQISKQAMMVGKVNFVTGMDGPMGDITVDVTTSQRFTLMAHLTPPVEEDSVFARRGFGDEDFDM